MIEILEESVSSESVGSNVCRYFDGAEFVAFASERSAGKVLSIRGRPVRVMALDALAFRGLDLVFFDASDAVSRTWVPHALEAGCWVVDHSGAFRDQADVVLGVPGVNDAAIDAWVEQAQARKAPRLISGPNCTTAQLVMSLAPLKRSFGLKGIQVSTYQSASGAGQAAIDELREHALRAANLESAPPLTSKCFPTSLAFQCIPQIGNPWSTTGFTSEEWKVRTETRKILASPELPVTCTAVRVPTLFCHAESVWVQLEKDPGHLDAVRACLAGQPGVILEDALEERRYPLNTTAKGHDAVFVGRLRRDPDRPRAILFWVVSDNLRKGAALNAIQLGERIFSIRGSNTRGS